MAETQLRTASSGKRVSDDWRASLPDDKNDLFEAIVHHWEASYAMLSVTLNESFALRRRGGLVQARQQAGVAADLAELLTFTLAGALRTLDCHARASRVYSRVEALNPRYFRGATGHRLASWNTLLHGILPADRFRFLQKIRSLLTAIEQMKKEFQRSATAIVEGTSTQPGACWSELDTLHYDLNTCLRESVVVLKSFLWVVPATEMESLRNHLMAPHIMAPYTPAASSRQDAAQAAT